MNDHNVTHLWIHNECLWFKSKIAHHGKWNNFGINLFFNFFCVNCLENIFNTSQLLDFHCHHWFLSALLHYITKRWIYFFQGYFSFRNVFINWKTLWPSWISSLSRFRNVCFRIHTITIHRRLSDFLDTFCAKGITKWSIFPNFHIWVLKLC